MSLFPAHWWTLTAAGRALRERRDASTRARWQEGRLPSRSLVRGKRLKKRSTMISQLKHSRTVGRSREHQEEQNQSVEPEEMLSQFGGTSKCKLQRRVGQTRLTDGRGTLHLNLPIVWKRSVAAPLRSVTCFHSLNAQLHLRSFLQPSPYVVKVKLH